MEYTPSWLPELLKEINFYKYNAFFGGFRHNHLAHAMYAMASLGATQQQVEETIKQAVNKRYDEYDEAKLHRSVEIDSIKSDNIQDYLGKDVGYYTILKHFIQVFENKYNKNRDEFIAGELPAIIDGPLEGAFHGIIQVAYGYAALSDQVVCEGVAYTYQVYSPIGTEKSKDLSEFGKGQVEPLDVLKSIRENKALLKGVDTFASALKNYSEDFIQLTDSMKLPDWFDPSEFTDADILKLTDWFMDLCVYVYTRSNIVNQFVVLHGITGTWSFRQVIHLLKPDKALLGLRSIVIAVLITYTHAGAPQLDKQPEEFWDGDIIDQAAWDKVIAEMFEKIREEHVYKVVQCCYQTWKLYPDSDLTKDYIAAAQLVIRNPYSYPPTSIKGRREWDGHDRGPLGT